MNSERWQKVKALFDVVVELAPSERGKFLAKSCGGDDEVRREVENLLASSENAESFMEQAAIGEVAAILVGENNDLPIGERFNHYKILSRLGAGGMGEVYLAEDTKLNRRVALKLLPPNLSADKNANRRLLREAQSAAALDHPHICQIHEIGEAEMRAFIVMQFCEGETLAEKLRQENLSLPDALDLAIQIADALADAHSHHVIHRDIKPENIIVNHRGQAKILDFGLAKIVAENQAEGEAETAQLLTAANLIIGTPPYMSPEQAKGKPLDARSDIFSFGAMLYEMLSGKQVFKRESHAETVSAVLNYEPPFAKSLADAPPELQRIVRKTLAKDKEERYQTAKDLLIDLKEARQESEFQNKLDRSSAPALSEPTAAAINQNPPAAAGGSDTMKIAQKTLSAEYVVSEIKNHKLTAIAALLVLTFGSAALYYFTRGSVSNQTANSAAINSLAVLPLKSLDAGENYLGLGIADAVIRRINQTGKLIVRPTSAVRRYLNEDTDALTAAKQLNADAVLEGSVQRADDRLRVSVNLLRTGDGVSLWADNFDMRMTDIFTIQDTVAQQVASRLRMQLDSSEQARLMKRSTSNPVAYEFYLKGVYSFDQRVSFGKPQMEATIGFFKQAIEADPNFALAHAQLAYVNAVKAVFNEPTETVWTERAKEEINRAQTLDPQIAEIHLARSVLLFSQYEEYQGEAAVREVRLAQQLNPNVGHGELAYLYNHLGLEDFAARELQSAFEIDPTSEFAKAMTLLMYEVGEKYDEYAAQRKLSADDYMEIWYFRGKNRLDEAQQAINKFSGENPDNLYLPPKKALLSALKGDFRAAEAEIPAILGRHPVKDPSYHHTAYDIACIFALEGKSVEAVKWLREANATGFQPYPLFERDAFLNHIRQTPEFIQFMAEMKAQNERYRREFAPTP